MRLEMPQVGDVTNAAELVTSYARAIKPGSGEAIEAEFNGSPMTGYPGDTAEVVRLRWHYERLLLQLKLGVITVRDLP